MTIKLLVVEDESNLRQIIVDKITEAGFSATSATSGYEAMRILETAKIDIVLTDYYMKDGDGGSLAHYCVRHKIPCIAITSLDPETVRPYVPKEIMTFGKADFIADAGIGTIIANVLNR